ncbi:hypothetical protein U1E44_01380 [Arenibacter sp. GZD96]|uniref:hypothetical protein n=1 Tax=Aurantibrevibacter litoralis TaxID=3106030 RepID=UPI002AFE66DC|nr:hypothetical protein [Arenibacter sp. GZD-96]MEA1784730.1 hypothetical protein [Arenibacter sp. GZD-96]
MYIESLNILYQGEFLISDIDDCIIYSSMSIRRHNIKKTYFYFNESIYDEFKRAVFLSAHLTPWGKEFLKLKQSLEFNDYLLLTASGNRMEILCEKLSIPTLDKIKENQTNQMKIDFLNCIDTPCIYVDDKVEVLNQISNNLVKTVLHR